ncbi:spermidine/spermine N1-acetyltransferase family member 2, partial [Chelydra serpentina]
PSTRLDPDSHPHPHVTSWLGGHGGGGVGWGPGGGVDGCKSLHFIDPRRQAASSTVARAAMECVVRPAQSADCDRVMAMIHEIAEYHNLQDEVKINSQVLRADGFGGDPFYQCLVAEVAPEQEDKQGK